jgi:hypothetical protein
MGHTKANMPPSPGNSRLQQERHNLNLSMLESVESVGGAGGGGGGGTLASVAVNEDAEDLAGANGQGQEFQAREGQERERPQRERQEREMLLIGTQFSHLYTGQGQEFLDLNCYADPSPPQPSAQGMY